MDPERKINPGPDENPRHEEGPSARAIPACRREDIICALTRNHYHKQKAAESLGISRSTLWRLIRKYEIE